MSKGESIDLQSEQDFALIIQQRRKSAGTYLRIATKAVADLASLLGRGEMPFDRDRYIYEGCRAMARYCHDNAIGDIALLDKSARPLWVGIGEHWKRAYPDQTRPRIHFINPALFRAVASDSQSPAELSLRLEIAGGMALEGLADSGSPLATDIDKPVLLADACMHSGRSVYLVKRALESVGFSNIHVGVINTTLPQGSPAMPDIFGTDNVIAARCLRSSPDSNLVQNDSSSIHSAPVYDVDALHNGTDLRNHVRDLVAGHFVAEQP